MTSDMNITKLRATTSRQRLYFVILTSHVVRSGGKCHLLWNLPIIPLS